MNLTPGTRLGAYEILGFIGAGGMGEVYRARDTRLIRDIALKVLPEQFVAAPERLARFRREAQLLASLNHPHIAAIYGFEEDPSTGVHALALELVDGPTLADRIAQGPVKITDILTIARQIIDALDAAHEQGIIHRDLKPANIKIRPDGTVKVLDFGLAKSLEAAGSPTGSAAPTITGASVAGTIVGTPAYMSPEQALGETVDKRTDIWAFGCVLFEMLGRVRPFTGQSTTETVAAVIRGEVEWSKLPPDTPRSMHRLLSRCLVTDRRRRLADIRDARLDLEDEHTGEPILGVEARGRRAWPERAAWAGALIVAIAVAAAAWTRRDTVRGPAPELRVEIAQPATTAPLSFALSPDGKKLAFVTSLNGRSQLWLRSLETGGLRGLRGTEGAAYPFWSPDSRSVAFFTTEKLYRMDIEGGAPRAIAFAPVGSGGAWSAEGVIVFPPVPDAPLMRVPENGGATTLVAPPGAGQGRGTGSPAFQGGHRFPQFLADGRHYLYYVRETRTVFVGALDQGPARRLLEADAAAVAAPPDRVLFVRDHRLFSQRIDLSRLEVVGEPSVVADGVAVDTRGIPAVSASAVGSLVYRSGPVEQQRRLAWFDRSGKEVGIVTEPDSRSSVNFSLSPDGRSVAMNRSQEGNTDVWILDLERKAAFERFTTDPTPEIVPVWSPDGGSILYSKVSGAGFRLVHKPRSGGSEIVLPVESRNIALDWSRNGRFNLYRTNDPPADEWNIWAVAADGLSKPFAVLNSKFDERTAVFSPDSKWIAYESNESGQYEIYVHPFPGPGEKWTVSSGGGSQPRWTRDGTELFYVAADGNLMSVLVRLPAPGQRIHLGTPSRLFRTAIESTVQGGISHAYDVSADGQRFLMSVVVEHPPSFLTLILNRSAR